MLLKNPRVCGRDPGALVGRLEELLRVVHVKLINRVVPCDQHGQRGRLCPATPSGLLPDTRDCPRESRKHRGVQAADVDAELHRVSRDQPDDVSVLQPPLRVPPVVREVAGTVWLDALPRTVQHIPGVVAYPLHTRPAPGERHGLHTPADQPGCELGSLHVEAWPPPVVVALKP